MRTLTIGAARRLAVAAQGLDRARPSGRIDRRHLRQVVRRLDVVQLDSVNVLTRAHDMPFFSRLGSGVDRETLRQYLWHSREVHECWAHVASVMPTDALPLLRHRQRERHPWDGVQQLFDRFPGYVEAVHAQVAERGPTSVSDLDDPGDRSEHFWGWSPGKRALHWLFLSGQLAVHERTSTFLATYDLPERVLPHEHLDAPAPPRDEATDALLLRAAGALGVATAEDLADYHRCNIVEARAAVDRLVRRGELVEVSVRGWDRPAYLLPDTRIPRRVRAAALLVPFDPMVWFRPRLERLFGFDYRIEIYVPAAKRVHGYYVLPFLLDDQLVARVDLKADRKHRRLRVQGAWLEPGQDAARVGAALGAELVEMATWLGLDEVEISTRGDLAPALRAQA